MRIDKLNVSSSLQIVSSSYDPLYISGSSAPKLFVSSSGDVLIGTGVVLGSSLLSVAGAISASSFQGDGSGLTGVTSYTDTDTLDYINSINVVSSSAQIASDISGAFSSDSASFSTRVSANEVITAKTLISGSDQLAGTTINGDLTLTGALTAQELHTEFISASIVYSTGSNKFGDLLTDSHQFTGSLAVSSSNNSYFLGGSLGVGNASIAGALDVFTGTATHSFPSILDGSISFLNGSPGVALPTIVGKSVSQTGLSFSAMSSDTPPYNIDMLFDIREHDNTDFATITNLGGFAFLRSGTELLRIARDGNTGINAGTPANKLSVGGNVSIGDNYTGLSAPTNGLIVQGNVGIGTTSPLSELHVSGSGGTTITAIRVENSYRSSFRAYNTGGTNASDNFQFTIRNDVGDGIISYYDSSDATFNNVISFVASTKYISIGGSTANVGIGTTSPTTKLDINGGLRLRGYDVNEGGQIDFDGGSSYPETTYLDRYQDQFRIFTTNATNSNVNLFNLGAGSMDLFVDGSVGIGTTSPGTTSPTEKLEVSGNILSTGQFISTQANSTATGGGQIYLNGATGNRIDFNRNGVGAPTFSTRSVGTKIVLYDFLTAGSADFALGIESSTMWFSVPNNTNQFFKWYGGTTNRMQLNSSNGDLHVDGDVIAYSTTVSDVRLKTNINTITSPLAKINNLRGVTYDWIKGNRTGQKDYGVIAQEVEKVLPELVREKEIPFIDSNEGPYKTVDYEKLTAVLIEAVKELSNEVTNLKSIINGNSR